MMIVNVKPRTRGVRYSNPSFDRILQDFFRDDTSFNGVTKNNPPVNILETAENFKIEVAAPGFDKANFSVNTEKEVLTIAAKKEVNNEAAGTLRRKEFSYSEFQRTFRLPDTVNQDAIEANYVNGVLTVTLPKKEETKDKAAKKIEIA